MSVPTAEQPASESQLDFQLLLARCTGWGASDVHLAVDEPARCRVDGQLRVVDDGQARHALTAAQLQEVLREVVPDGQRSILEQRGSVDGAFTSDDQVRWRFNAYRRSGQFGIALRRLESRFRSLSDLGLTEELYRVCEFGHGLVVVAGPTGSGKSTTLATLIDRINQMRSGHIITLEDPVEYIHSSRRCLVTQRQVGIDSPGFHQALIDALRQDPDVILVGEIRDLDTIRTAITAAETGHLVFASVHAGDCVGAIDRLVSVFPADEQKMIQRLLSLVLRAVVAQHLLVPLAVNGVGEGSRPGPNDPRRNRPSNRVLASEVLFANAAVANLIAQGNTKQIYSVMETGSADGMQTLDVSLARLYRQRYIGQQTAQSLARNPQLVVDRKRPLPAAAL